VSIIEELQKKFQQAQGSSADRPSAIAEYIRSEERISTKSVKLARAAFTTFLDKQKKISPQWTRRNVINI
jgi:hypothetical protein